MQPLARHGDVGSGAGDASEGGSDGCLVRRGGIDRARPRTGSDRAHRGPVPIDHPHGAGGRHGPLHRVRDDPSPGGSRHSPWSSRSSRPCSRPTRWASSPGTCRRRAACTPTSSRGLGSFFGWLMAWAFTLAEPVVPAALYASFGLFGAAFITELTGYSNDMLWLPLAVIAAWSCGSSSTAASAISTRVGVVLGLDRDRDLPGRRRAAHRQRGQPGRHVSVFIPADGGFMPALQGMVFCLLAFVGFEAAAPLGEETREPKRTIPRAVVLCRRS